ncbi:HEPN domain-containing protein [Marinoscillum sp. MHG1-6]|uniref:HEPN domain-containing protein n=1 Tax=Marinoscillum sp. MHG1-6 TaxID=2959627 RepID=UPI0021581D4F|nr:HEPN domain-containing protein [Marinoscillum sp. MHG1-6]
MSALEGITKAGQADVEELKARIDKFKTGQEDEDRFKAFRLTRGVYGQRQFGVHMYRLKLPYGKITADQMRVVADLSVNYGSSNLHLTTRQNIQLHYVKLEDSPLVYEALENCGLTSREACGNTVRNITASPYAGIDPREPFNVVPYVDATFQYFLRNPICQDMGRKIKIAFASNDEDIAFTYMHDFGFTPVVKDGQRGFKVLVGGGLGAQAFMAQLAYDFLPVDQLIPFIEASLRVFDRYGERERRHKARLKFLIEPKKGLGLDGFMDLVEEERKSLPYHSFPIEAPSEEEVVNGDVNFEKLLEGEEDQDFLVWAGTNVFEQKQKGLFAVKVKIPLGDIKPDKANQLADIVDKYADEDIRITVNQGLLFRNIQPENVKKVYEELKKINFSEAGFDTLADVTACPGTDTCNLGVTNSTAVSLELEKMIKAEYPHLIDESLIKIKISGCMNSCGQHMVGNIGFHGSSIKVGEKVCPAQQVVLGGGVDPDGKGYIAEKVIKLPTKRILDCVRWLLNDFEQNSDDNDYFNAYVRKQGKMYFYELLKPLADTTTLKDSDFQDWGKEADFIPEIGVGECAGVMMDLVGTILGDAQDRYQSAQVAFENGNWANAIYYTYNAMVIGAKATLLGRDIQCNTHIGIIEDFEKKIQAEGLIQLDDAFSNIVLQINKNEPTKEFAEAYLKQAKAICSKIVDFRNAESEDKLVISNFYKA